MTETRTCKYEPCSKRFEPTHWRQEFCEPKCRNDHFYALNPEKRASSATPALPCVATPPLQAVRDQQAAKKHNRDLGGLIRQAIVNQIRTTGECCADDLIPLYPEGEVDECRRLATAQFGSLASGGDGKHPLIQEKGRRKSSIRPERIAECLPEDWGDGYPNVWLGVTIENRRFVDRADLLRAVPAAVRFISAEPLLGPLVPNWWDDGAESDDDPPEPHWPDGKPVDHLNPALDLGGIDWLIAGGESGIKHRPIEAAWVKSLRDACRSSGDLCTACAGGGFAPDAVGHWSSDPCSVCGGSGHLGGTRFFFKQWGGRTPKSGGRLLDGRTYDEFPTGATAE